MIVTKVNKYIYVRAVQFLLALIIIPNVSLSRIFCNNFLGGGAASSIQLVEKVV